VTEAQDGLGPLPKPTLPQQNTGDWLMRMIPACLALTLALSACGGSAPPPTPVVINTPPAPPPVIASTAVLTPTQSALVAQCQSLFSQAMGGRAMNYSSPAIATAAGSTTIHLAGVPYGALREPATQYSCSYSGGTLTAAGLG